MGCAPEVLMQFFFAMIVLQGLCCSGCTAEVVLQVFNWIFHTGIILLQELCCRACTEGAVLQGCGIRVLLQGL